MTLRMLALALLALATTTPAIAQSKFSNELKRRPDAKAEEIQKRAKLYTVTIECERRGNLQSAAVRRFASNPTRSQTIILSNTPPGKDDKNERTRLPTDAIAVVHVFSVGGTGSVKDVDDQRGCKRTQLIKGARPYYLISNINETTSYTDLEATISVVTGLVSPIVTLFTGAGVLPAAATGFVTNFQGLQKPFQDFLKAMNNGQNSFATTEALQVGEYFFETPVSGVTVKIEEVPSIALADNAYLRFELLSQIGAAKRRLTDEGGLDTNCRVAAGGLRQLGITSPIDVAYGLIAMAASVGLEKDKLVRCLTRTYAEQALKIPEETWIQAAREDLIFDNQFLIDNLPEPPPRQPSYDVINRGLTSLITALNQFGANSNPPPVTMSTLNELVADNVAIYDSTFDVRFAKSFDPKPRMEALAAIFKEYSMVGCRMATTSATDRDVDGAPAMFLAFKIGKGQKTTTRDNIVVIRPIYTALKVSRINVTQDQDHIDVILKAIPACKARVAEDAKPTDNAKLTDNPDPPKSR